MPPRMAPTPSSPCRRRAYRDEKALLTYYQQVGKMTDLPLVMQTQDQMSVDLVVQAYKTIPNCRTVKDEAAAVAASAACDGNPAPDQ